MAEKSEGESLQKPAIEGLAEKVDESLDRFKKLIGLIFDNYENGSDRIKELISKSQPRAYSDYLDVEKILTSLQECSDTQNREEFIARVFEAMKPMIEFLRNDPKITNPVLREAYNGLEQKTLVEKVLSYNYDKKDSSIIDIHLSPSRDLVNQLKTLIPGELKALAKIVEANENIKTIRATSWILATRSGPNLIKRLGFTGRIRKISEEEKKERGIQEQRPMSEGTMSREDFLNKYLG